MFPDFIIIGAMKSGTTSLYSYLNAHENIQMSKEKEPGYFAHNYDKPSSWYRSLFSDDPSCLKGEASTHYTKYPIHEGVPARICKDIPGVKLIYLVRDPVERILSQYIHKRSHDAERRPISECLEIEPANSYIACSRYATQLKQYIEYFDRSQILVVESERLREARQETMREVFDFLNLPTVDSDIFRNEANQSKGASERNWLARRISEIKQLHRVYAAVPESIRTRLQPLYRSSLEKPNLPDVLRRNLSVYLRPEVEWLRKYTGKAFKSWSL